MPAQLYPIVRPTALVDVSDVRRHRRHVARACLDLTERRHHLAGALGAALATNLLKKGWLRRRPEGRAVSVSKAGQMGFKRTPR